MNPVTTTTPIGTGPLGATLYRVVYECRCCWRVVVEEMYGLPEEIRKANLKCGECQRRQ